MLPTIHTAKGYLLSCAKTFLFAPNEDIYNIGYLYLERLNCTFLEDFMLCILGYGMALVHLGT